MVLSTWRLETLRVIFLHWNPRRSAISPLHPELGVALDSVCLRMVAPQRHQTTVERLRSTVANGEGR